MLTRCILVVAIVVAQGVTALPADTQVRVMDRPPAGENTHYISNRAPLQLSRLVKLPIGAIEPQGWIKKQLELQADGFHGHLGEISRFLKKEGNAWLSQDGRGDHGWEEAPYWLKGYGNCAYLLHEQAMIAEAKVWIEAAISSQKSDGWFGPDQEVRGIASQIAGRSDLWPNMVMLFCLQDYYDFTGDQRVIDLMTRYMRYLHDEVPADRLLNGYWPVMRGGDLLLSVYWLYNRTGDEWLLKLGEKVHADTARWDEDVINWHNVNIAQGFGEPGTYFLQSGDPKHLEAAYRNHRKVRELYGQVPGGMFGADENARPGYNGPRQAIETCGIVEEMLSDETLLLISGDPFWADHCELVAFNSLPAALTADMKALRYLTAPNHILSDAANKSPGLQNGGPMYLMSPHNHRCCQHNWGHGWPYYAQHLWAATSGNGLAAVMYAPCDVTAKVGPGDGTEVKVTVRTDYPFGEDVTFRVETPAAVAFPLYLRVPGWCDAAKLAIRGKPCEISAEAGEYLALNRTWSDGDEITLTLPMQTKVRRWETNHNFASVQRGPLTYSLQIGEQYVRHDGSDPSNPDAEQKTDQWPSWEIRPTTPWNYGLVLNEKKPASSFELVQRQFPDNDMPFTHDGVPVMLRVEARRIPEWKMDHLGLVGKMQDSPVKSDEPNEMVILIPMGAARLRVSALPVVGEGSDAHQWQEAPPAPSGPAIVRDGVKVSCSHCFDRDTVAALNDKQLPKNSNDHTIPRHTCWPNRGTKEWLQYEFEEPRQVSSVQVYWFDDTGQGLCRVPASWRLLYQDGEAWKPVSTNDAFATTRDRLNRVEFDSVNTTGLRIEMQLQQGLSAGALEWIVN